MQLRPNREALRIYTKKKTKNDTLVVRLCVDFTTVGYSLFGVPAMQINELNRSFF